MDHPNVNRRHQAIEKLETGASLFLDHRDPATVKCGSTSSGWLADACVHVNGKNVEWMEEIRDEPCNLR